MKVADVDICNHKIIKVHANIKKRVNYKEDLDKHGENRFSDEIRETGLQTLLELKDIASQYKPNEYAAICTSACREAKNGQAFVKDITERPEY